ncbi:hypothetical protein [Streptomyces sp. NPDC017941]
MSLQMVRFRTDNNPLVGLPDAAQLRELIRRAAGAPVPPEPFAVVGRYSS